MTIALVLGGGSSVWADADAALEMTPVDGIVACNDAAEAWPGRLDAAVSLHAEKMGYWMERRARRGHPAPDRIIGHTSAKASTLRIPSCITDFVEYKMPGQSDTGSSGHFAMKAALDDLGFSKVILCGIPMDDRFAHFFDSSPWGGAAAHRRGWSQTLHLLQGRVRSMSGWTADQLGRPDDLWLAKTA